MSKKLDIEFYELVVNTKEYVCISKYKNRTDKVLMLHLKCGKYYYQSPSKFKIGRRCHHCSPSKKLTKEYIQYDLDLKFPNKYTILSDYKNSTTKILVRDNECGHEYLVKQQDIREGSKCFKCHGSKKYTHEEFENIFNNHKLHGFSLVDKYDGINKKIKIKHDECGTEFYIRPASYLKNGKNCPSCSPKSIGELKTKQVLNDLNIKYIEQKRFDDCKDKGTLPFDFYLPDKNICIEYQGIQHYQPIMEFGGDNAFKECIKRDKIKKRYCINNGILLIEIPYWEKENIRDIIVEKVC